MERKEITDREKGDIRILLKFVEIFCRENHDGNKRPFSYRFLNLGEIEPKDVVLCPDCAKLIAYGLTMRLRCPYDPKPMCKKCKTQCYRGEYKSKIREVMKFSGMYLIKHGRLDLLYHYFI